MHLFVQCVLSGVRVRGACSVHWWQEHGAYVRSVGVQVHSERACAGRAASGGGEFMPQQFAVEPIPRSASSVLVCEAEPVLS